MVLDDDQECVKCSINEVIDLLESYNTSERLTSEIRPVTYEAKKKKAEENESEIEFKKEALFIKELEERSITVFDDYETYRDENEILETPEKRRRIE